jgi:TonB-linked SusC/RagA family outer membrane protein
MINHVRLKRIKSLRFYSLIIFMFFWLSNIKAQTEIVLKGKVTDKTGIVLPSVSIVESGTENGVTTDFNGNFTITISKPPSSLVFRYLGFKSKIIKVTKSETLTVVLNEDVSSLDEIVVVGYGTARKSDLTGALSSVDSKSFEKTPLTSAVQAIQGRASGVQVTQTSGAPGGGFKVRVRGANSFGSGNEPLYVIDGVFVNNIDDINVNDIKSFEILKDASSTAIYGSFGANGVVLISTKSGKKGKAKVEINSFTKISNVTKRLPLMSALQFAEGVNFAEGSEFYDMTTLEALRLNGGEDWHSRIFRSGSTFNTQVSISGGSENTDYLISANFNDEEGSIINQEFKRYSFRTNLNTKLSKNTKIGIRASVNHQELKGSRANVEDGLTWDPTTPAFNEEGIYNIEPLIQGVGNGEDNVLISPENNIRETNQTRLSLNGYLNTKIFNNFTFNASGSIDHRLVDVNRFTPFIINPNGFALVRNDKETRFQQTNRLTYKYADDNDKHDFKVDLIQETFYRKDARTDATATNFVSEQNTYKNFELAEDHIVENSSSDRSINSFIGRINYSFLDRYLVTASYRADGASVLSKENRWSYFPSASIAWKVSNEEFLKDNETINSLKLRIGYGETGTQSISPRGTIEKPVVNRDLFYPFSGDNYTIGIAPTNRLANPNLTWEITKQLNTGIDVGLFNSKATLSLDYYQKNTTGILLDVDLDPVGGTTKQAVNAGEMQNNGFDISLGLSVFENDDWNISSSFNVTTVKSEVISLIDGKDVLRLGNDDYGNFAGQPTEVRVGQSMSSFIGYVFEGVWQNEQEIIDAGFNSATVKPGHARYQDQLTVDTDGDGIFDAGDGVITSDDITTIGSGLPDLTWGMNWDINYKKFNLNLAFTGSQGNDIFNLMRSRMMGLGAKQFHAVHSDYLNRWSPTNPSSIPNDRDTTKQLSSQFIEDGSYTALKNASFGYTLDSEELGNSFLSSLRLYVNAENLFIITNYSGFDPETTATGNSDLDLGIDINTHPLNRSFTFGVKATF